MVYESSTNTRRKSTRQYRVVSNSKGVRWMNLNENLAVTVGGGFFGGILIGYALKKIIKIVDYNCWIFSICPGVSTVSTNRQY